MNACKLLVPALAISLAVASHSAIAADTNSTYSEVASDAVIGSSDTTVLVSSINLPKATWVYLQTDGRAYPNYGGAISAIWITADGSPVGSTSVIDWSVSKDPQQHSYNAIGAVYLKAGTHTIALHARSLNSVAYTLGATSNLDVLVNPATTVTKAQVPSDTGQLTYNVYALPATSALPTGIQASATVNGANGSTLVALSSARIYEYGHDGDPLTTIGMDGSSLPIDQASWSDNDMYGYAENQAPFFTHALIKNLSTVNHTLQLMTSALPYSSGNNQVAYRMGAGSTLIGLQGGMSVVGSSPQGTDAHNVTKYICVGTSQNWAGCPNIGTAVPIAQADITIPAGNNGVVLITGKTRIQGGNSDAGGTGYLYLTVDGVRKGSLGVQQLQSPDSVSTRTLGTSYLATGANALAPGTHHVVLYAQASGSFIHLAYTLDLPLIWFD